MGTSTQNVVAVLKVSGPPFAEDVFIVALLHLNDQGRPADRFEWLTPENAFLSLDRARDIARVEAQIRELPLKDAW
jgi:hypothetical protein